jgi:tetratricopeptide (TPR) repeat protein
VPPAPGNSWARWGHRSLFDPHFHRFRPSFFPFHRCHFFFDFFFPAWWWWDAWWSWWWTPHVHFVAAGPTVYVATAVPSYAVCEEGRSHAEEERSPESDRVEDLAQKQVRLADLYFRMGRYEDAARAYRRAIEASPGTASLRFTLADALFASGDVEGAAQAVREGVALDATLVSSDVDKRTFYGKAEDFERQVASLAERVAKNPADRDALLVLGTNLLFSGRAEKAREVLERARDLPGAGEAEGILFAEADRRTKDRK